MNTPKYPNSKHEALTKAQGTSQKNQNQLTNPCLEEALRLARGGYHVGITTPKEKKPHLLLMAKDGDSKGGVWKATTNEKTIESWWRSCPEGGVFISPRGELVAIDIDDPQRFKNELGERFLDRMIQAYPTTQTPSGGLHIWARVPVGVKATVLPRKLSFGETIYEGFYALVPPSTARAKSGKEGSYQALTPLPQNITDVPVLQSEDLDKVSFSQAPKSREIIDGERHNALLSRGIKLGRLGFSVGEIEPRLWEYNDSFHPPYVDQEAKEEIKGVLGWVNEKIINGDIGDAPISAIRFISMSELADRPAPKWLIPNLIPDSGLGFLIGQPEAGKSFFLQELAQSVCRGAPLFGDKDLVPNRSGWVLCLLPEAAPSWAVRTRTYCDYHGVDYSDQFQCCIQPLDLGNKDIWNQVFAAATEETKRRGEPPVLVILDTLSAAIPGRDENSQSDMTPLMAHLQEFIGMGSAVIVAHHPAKYSETYRGSSVLRGSCDWMISIIKLASGLREFKANKLRDVEQISRKAFLLEKHAESAVCISADTQGPWGLLEAFSDEYPGLKEALLYHGFDVPGEIRRKAKDGDVTAEGVSLKRIKETWRHIDPIQPSSKTDLKKYKAQDRDRTTMLFSVISAMITAGVLDVIDGRVSKSDRKLDGVVKQVFTDVDA